MDVRSLEKVDYFDFLEFLAPYCQSQWGKETVCALKPFLDLSQVDGRREELHWFADFVERVEFFPPLHDIFDPRDYFRDSKHFSLGVEELFFLGKLLETLDSLVEVLVKYETTTPWKEFEDRKKFYPVLLQRIKLTFDDQMEVMDSASPELKRVRRELGNARSRLESKAQETSRKLFESGVLQDNFITQRDDRLVLPLNKNFKGKIHGTIHGASKTGNSLFFEPEDLVVLNNQIARLKHEESSEIRRILRALSNLAISMKEPLFYCSDKLVLIDLLRAINSYQKEWQARYPAHSSSGDFNFIDLKHPLLGKDAVPITLFLSKQKPVLLISGPNAGGKTVFLKTFGLFMALNQTGVPIPIAEGSEVPFIKNLFVELGDDQSIFTQLSRFSSHMSQVAQIVKRANSATLVLIDELAGATSYSEGNALACAITLELEKRKIPSVVSSHFEGMKALESSDNGIRNAAFQFNMQDLSPTYRLTYDAVGASFALAIAQNFGLKGEVLERANDFIEPDSQRLDSLIRQLQKKIRRVERRDAKLSKLLRENSEVSARLAADRDAFNEKKKLGMAKVIEEEMLSFSRVRKEMEETIARLRKSDGDSLHETDHKISEIIDSQESLDRKLNELTSDSVEPVKSTKSSNLPLKVGDEVIVSTLGGNGFIEKLGKKKILVNISGKQLWLKADQVERANHLFAGGQKKSVSSLSRSGFSSETVGSATVFAPDTTRVSSKINVVGERFESALDMVSTYLDQALLSGWAEVSVIHGKGNGILKKGIREYLKKSSQTFTWREAKDFEGGAGVTIVILNDS